MSRRGFSRSYSQVDEERPLSPVSSTTTMKNSSSTFRRKLASSFRRQKSKRSTDDKNRPLSPPCTPPPIPVTPPSSSKRDLPSSRSGRRSSSRRSVVVDKFGDLDSKGSDLNRSFDTVPVTPESIRSTAPTSPSTISSTPESLSDSNRSSKRSLSRHEARELDEICKAAEALDKAGNTLFRNGHYKQAMMSYTRALKLKRRTLSMGIGDHPKQREILLASVATSINNIGYLRQQSGATTKEVMSVYRDSLIIKKQILGKEHLAVGKTLNNIGSVHFSEQHHSQAMLAYQEALKVMMLNLGPDHLDVATVHSNIGDVYLATKKLEGAKKHYKTALSSRWEQLGEKHPKTVRLMEKIASIEMAHLDVQVIHSSGSIGRRSMEYEEESVEVKLRGLKDDVAQDIEFVEIQERELRLNMIKDKLQLIREMRKLEAGSRGAIGDMLKDGVKSPARPMTPVERVEALSSVKERLARMRQLRNQPNCLTPPIHTSSPVTVRTGRVLTAAALSSAFEKAAIPA